MEPRVIQSDIKGVSQTIVMLPGGLTGWHSWTIRLQSIQNELGAQGVAGDLSYTTATERESEFDGDHACHIQQIDQFLAAFEAHLNRGGARQVEDVR